MAMTKVLVTLALVAAAWGDALEREMYDDISGDMELVHPEQNYLDMMPEPKLELPAPPRVGLTIQPRKYEDISHERKMILYNMLMSLRNHDASPTFLSVPKWIPTGTVLVPPDTFNFSHLKGPLGPMFKRSPGGTSRMGVKPNPRPPQKWNIKKVKTGSRGSPKICYLKICSY